MLSCSSLLVAASALVVAVLFSGATDSLSGAFALHLLLSLAPLPTCTVGASFRDGLEFAFQVVQLIVAVPIWVATTYVTLGTVFANFVRRHLVAAADLVWRYTAAPRRALVHTGSAAWYHATMWYALSLVLALVLVREALSFIDFVIRTSLEAWGCFVWPRVVQYARDRIAAVKVYIPDLDTPPAVDQAPVAPPPPPPAAPVVVVVPPTPPARAPTPATMPPPPRPDWLPGPYPVRPRPRPRHRRSPVLTIVEGEPLEGLTQEGWVARAEASAAVAADYVWVLREMEERVAAGVPIFVIPTDADKARSYVRRHDAHERDMLFWAIELLNSQLDY